MSCPNREWNAIGNGFCENLVYGGFPEYANAYSSWFITLIGVYGLFYSKIQSTTFRWLYSFYLWSGIGSFLFHYYGYRFYGQLDTVPLLLASWILVYESWRIVLEKFDCLKTQSGWRFEVCEKFLDTIALGCTLALTLTLSARAVGGRPWGMEITFTKAFATPQLLSCASLPIMWLQRRNDRTEGVSVAFRYVLYGFVIALSSAILWLATEPYCRVTDEQGEYKYPAIKYLYTHVVWHIGIIWGAHYLIQVGLFFDCLNRGIRVRFKTNNFYKVFPIVEYVD